MTDQPTAKTKPRRLWLKILLAVVCVVGLVLGTGALVDALSGDEEYSGLPSAAQATMPDVLDPAGFSTGLSAAAAAPDPAAFLAYFAPALQEDARRWHANLQTLGTDRVLAVFRSDGGAESLAADSIPGRLQVGFHLPGIDGAETDPREPLTGMAPEPNRMPSTEYAVTVLRGEEAASGVIQAWSPAGAPAPWDVQQLVAVSGPGYILATGAANEGQLARFQAPTAQAADYTTNLFRELLPDLPDSGLDNPGFLLFLEPDDALFSTYFVTDRNPGPISEVAGYAVAMPSAAGESAGSRVVMRPTPEMDTFASIAVHEFVHVMFHSTPNQSFLPTGHKDPGVAWISEGVAEWIQTRYTEQGFTGPTLDAVRAAVAQGFFQDRPPTNDELYLQPEFGYPVAASVFQWLSETFDVATAFEAASDNLLRGFDELFPTLFYPSDRDFQAEWAAWVRNL